MSHLLNLPLVGFEINWNGLCAVYQDGFDQRCVPVRVIQFKDGTYMTNLMWSFYHTHYLYKFLCERCMRHRGQEIHVSTVLHPEDCYLPYVPHFILWVNVQWEKDLGFTFEDRLKFV